jgi:hypothetical protein
MNRSMRIIFAAAIIVIGAMNTMAIEEAPYNVVARDDKFEIRDYAPHILAETIVEGDLEQAGSKAFSRLFGYISGENRSRDKLAMTAPVSQEPMGEEIKMTAPVGQQRVQEKWVVSFMMPASYTLETFQYRRTRMSPCVRYQPDGWPRCATPVCGAKRITFDTRWSSNRGFMKEALPLWAIPYGRATIPLSPLVFAAERDFDTSRCRC